MFSKTVIQAKLTLSRAVSPPLRRFEHPECNTAPNLPRSAYLNSAPGDITCERASSVLIVGLCIS
jgi:hypothetical protein